MERMAMLQRDGRWERGNNMSPALQAAAKAGRLQATLPGKPRLPFVLVVDDEANFTRRLKMALEAAGFDAAAALDGEAALAQVAIRVPDLIVLDVMMPGMDGISCLRALRARLGPSDPPVILVTGYGGTAVEVAGLVYNVAGIVRKPCTFQDVIDVAKRTLFPGSSPE